MSTTPRRLVTARAPRRGPRPRPRCGRSGCPSSSASSRRAPISRCSSRPRGRANEALDHVLFVGPPGPRQDHAGADRRARARRQLPRHLGPGDRQGRRSRGAAHQSGGARRSLHRRDPPAQSGGRGNPLSGDGGFPARPHHRRRAGGALGEDRSRQVHAGRRDHARGPAHQSAARPLRHPDPAQFLHRGRAGADRQPRRPRARHRHDARTAPTRSRGARAARRASPDGCCAACATSPMSAASTRSTASSPTGRCSSSRSMPPASTPWTGAISRPSPRTTAAGRSGVETLAAALSEPRDAIEEIIEPFLIQKGFLQRTPRGRLITGARLQASRPRRAGARSVAVRVVRRRRERVRSFRCGPWKADAIAAACASASPPTSTASPICNCSICTKKGIWHLIVPPERFELLQRQETISRPINSTPRSRSITSARCAASIRSMCRAPTRTRSTSTPAASTVSISLAHRAEALRRPQLGSRDAAARAMA